MRHQVFILAIQEHTAWRRELTEAEKTSYQRTCNRYGFLIFISKLQIIMVDKQLTACIRETDIHEEGRIIRLRLEIATNQYVNFIATYGYPHSPKNRSKSVMEITDENTILQKMRQLNNILTNILKKAMDQNELMFVFGDQQDTPDRSKAFSYSPNNIIKHPLGIVQTCENEGLECTINKFMESMHKPIISRHGTKGGRFIDGMYALKQAHSFITGITIVEDTGIFSDHNLVISKCDLGLQQFSISMQKEEKIDFRRILNIPMSKDTTSNHPILSDSVYKGIMYQEHAKLYNHVQDTVLDKDHGIMLKIDAIKQKLEEYEQHIIA